MSELTYPASTPKNELPAMWLPLSVEGLRTGRELIKAGLLPTHHNLLHDQARPVPLDEIDSKRTRDEIDKMRRIAEKFGMMGIAAPQVGINARIFLGALETPNSYSDPTELRAYVNPSYQPLGEKVTEDFEACFSVQGGFGGMPLRAEKILLQGYDPKGKLVEEELELYGARIASHEIDHLDGRLYPKLLFEQNREFHLRPPELKEQYNQGCYNRAMAGEAPAPQWPLVVPETQWLAMRLGVYSLDRFTLPEDM